MASPFQRIVLGFVVVPRHRQILVLPGAALQNSPSNTAGTDVTQLGQMCVGQKPILSTSAAGKPESHFWSEFMAFNLNKLVLQARENFAL